MKKLIIFVVFCFMSISSVIANPNVFYGEVAILDKEVIGFDDEYFSLSPTVKVFNKKNQKVSISTIRKGDLVSLELIKIGKKQLVDIIFVLPK